MSAISNNKRSWDWGGVDQWLRVPVSLAQWTQHASRWS